MRRLRLAVLPLLTLCTLCVPFGSSLGQQQPPKPKPALKRQAKKAKPKAAETPVLRVGQKAPAFTVTDPTGKVTYTLAKLLKGNKAAIVYTWCHT